MERSSAFYKLRRLGQKAAYRVLPQETLAKIYSRAILHDRADLKDPKTFNEKVQWLKIHSFPDDPLVVRCADKYAVRGYVEEKGLGATLVPSLGAWTSPDDIDWGALPDSFVLKCAHGCAYNVICPDKLKLDEHGTKRQLGKWLKEDFGVFNVEPHYSKITPRMIVGEEFLGDGLTDYKFFCFNGEPRYIYISYDLAHDRQAKIGYYDIGGKPLGIERDDYAHLDVEELPPYFDEMRNAAKALCEDFTFVRVDFFATASRFYFAELTFTPSAGMMPFNPRKYDLEWGLELDISKCMDELNG